MAPNVGQPALFLGTASYGISRPDVAAAYGSQFTSSGYSLTSTLSANTYVIVVYAHSTVTNAWSQSMTRWVRAETAIVANIDAPATNATVSQPFGVTGWAVDGSATTTNGVPFMHAYIYVNGVTPQWVGQVNTIANSRPDIGAWLQAPRFSDSGWGFTVPAGTVPAGTHLLVIYPYSSVTNAFGTALLRWITVQ